jgi:hypothetical protein
MKRTASDVAIERLWTDHLIVIEIGVRDHIAPVDVMLGQVAAPNQTPMKRIDEKQSPIAKRITARVVWPIPYSPLLVEATAETVTVTVTLTDRTAVGAKRPSATMTAKGGTEKMSVRNCIGAEVTPGGALMSYLGVTRNQADDDELTVMPKVLEVPGYQRFVPHPYQPQRCKLRESYNKYNANLGQSREQEETPAHEIDHQVPPVSDVSGLELPRPRSRQKRNQLCTLVARRGRSKKNSLATWFILRGS